MAKKAKKEYVRRLRHWKQRYDKNAEFIWRKPIVWGGKKMKPGKPIPKDLAAAPTKLRRFWESHTIELALFEAPDISTGQPKLKFDFDIPEGVVIKQGNATWFEVHFDGEEHKVNGMKALEAYINELADNIELNAMIAAEEADQNVDVSVVFETEEQRAELDALIAAEEAAEKAKADKEAAKEADEEGEKDGQ